MSDDFEFGGQNEMEFFRPTLPFWIEVHRQRTNHVWPFQRDYEMHEVTQAHCRASARWAFGVKKYINFNLF